MKLSTAILNGIPGTVKTTGEYYTIRSRREDNKFVQEKCACTLGCALKALGIQYTGSFTDDERVIEIFGDISLEPPVKTLPLTLDGSEVKFNSLYEQITWLNDYTNMTREDIAAGLAAAGL